MVCVTKVAKGHHGGGTTAATEHYSCHNEDGDVLEVSSRDVEVVMVKIGMSCDGDGEKMKECLGSDELSVHFEEKEPSLEEVKEAFDVFDENRDGFVDARELQRVLCNLGFKEALYFHACVGMIRAFDKDGDNRIDFNERFEGFGARSFPNYKFNQRILFVVYHSIKMYGRRASQLVRELASSESGQLTAFNTDLFDQVIKECNEHQVQLQSLLRKIQDDGLDIQTTKNADHFGAVAHHLSLIRNKRCLMAYMHNRAEIIRSLRWKVGPVLPQEIQQKLSYSEEEYFKNHSTALESYMSELDLDLTVDMVPPKDPYIQVRVLDDIGDVLLGDQSASLMRNSVHSLKCTDAEQFISQLLANVILAGEEHCQGVWNGLFPSGFADLGRVRRFEVCDPLCRVLYVCCEESEERFGELSGDHGMKIVAEIVRMASAGGMAFLMGLAAEAEKCGIGSLNSTTPSYPSNSESPVQSHESKCSSASASFGAKGKNAMAVAPVELLENSDAVERNDDRARLKLKPLHWDKVRASSDRAMLWDQLKSRSFQLNEETIETLFMCNSANSLPKETRSVPTWLNQENRVLDPKESHNIAILLRALNVTKEEACEVLLDGNTDGLGTELLETLLRMAPTKEEEIKLKEYKEDSPFRLGPVERFLKSVLDIPFAFKKVDVMLYVANFDSEVKYLKRSFETLEVVMISGVVISVVLMVCVTKVAKAALDKALAENMEVDGILATPQLPIVSEPPLDLHQPLIVKINPSG
ncbi:hypothetical protein AAC387_Pa09g0478 [Persea americana]